MDDKTSDTCPSCGSIVVIPHTGEWVRCDRPGCKGKLRWKPDGQESPRRTLLDAERQHLQSLREELKEIDGWVREGIAGAAEMANRIQRQLLKLMGED